MRNKFNLIVTFCILGLSVSTQSRAQTYEIGAFVGGANYIGDVGDTQFIAPAGPTFGGIAKWNRSTRHAFRLTYLVAQIMADDLDSKDTRRLQRGYSFENTLSEVSLGIEYTFWEFDLHEGTPAFAPYMYTGFTYTWYDALRKTGTLFDPVGRETTYAIPMVLGLKKNTRNQISSGFGSRGEI